MSRINRVTTATGDNGTTALGTGRRVSKTDPIITALGSVDELSSLLGILRNHQINDELIAQLIDIQQALFDLGAILAMEGQYQACLLYTSPSPRDATLSRMPSSA